MTEESFGATPLEIEALRILAAAHANDVSLTEDELYEAVVYSRIIRQASMPDRDQASPWYQQTMKQFDEIFNPTKGNENGATDQ